MTATIDAIGEAIVERLRSQLPLVRVEHFPDSPDRSATLLAAPDAMFVHWKGGTDSDPQAIAPMSTEETIEWWVVLTCRSLRGPSGIAQRVEDVWKALAGWRPPQGGTPFVRRATEFVDEAQGVWRYRMRWSHRLTRVAKRSELTGPALQGPTIKGTP